MFDVIVIGGGPAGLNATLILARARREVLLVDDEHPRNAHALELHGFLSRDGQSPTELRRIGREEVSAYPTVAIRDAKVTHAAAEEEARFRVTFVDGDSAQARRLLLATGRTDRLPDVEGLSELWGRSALNCPYCHGFELVDLPLAVLGNDEATAKLAVHLTRFTDDIVLCTDGPARLGDAETAVKLCDIPVMEDEVVRLEGSDGSLNQIVFRSRESMPRHAVFLQPPLGQHHTLACDLGCEVMDDDSILIDEFGKTSVPGIYAAGDTARPASWPLPPVKLILSAASGSIAAMMIDQDLLHADLEAQASSAWPPRGSQNGTAHIPRPSRRSTQ